MRILVTGGSGLIGRALQTVIPDGIFVNSQVYNLTNPVDVDNLFKHHMPTHVIHLAGMVGGVGINQEKPVEFFEQNILMNTLVLQAAHKYNVKRLAAFMSTCVFPDDVEYPLTPAVINDGPPHYSNFGYAYAKRMLGVQIEAYQKEYGREWFGIIPTNVYGKWDNFNLKTAHVIPALIHKCYLAKWNNTPLEIWGDGTPIREFIYSEDVARITYDLLMNYRQPEPIIVSTSEQTTVKDVVDMIVDEMIFTGEVIYDASKPSGQLRKPSDITPLKKHDPQLRFTPLHIGMHNTVSWFKEHYSKSYVRK